MTNNETLRKWESQIRQIRESLAAAYGGYSQFGSTQIAAAIRGHINNGILHLGAVGEVDPEEFFLEAALQEEDQWPDCLDHETVKKEIATAFAALEEDKLTKEIDIVVFAYDYTEDDRPPQTFHVAFRKECNMETILKEHFQGDPTARVFCEAKIPLQDWLLAAGGDAEYRAQHYMKDGRSRPNNMPWHWEDNRGDAYQGIRNALAPHGCSQAIIYP